MKKNVESNIFFEVQKYYFVFKSRLIFFSNGHFRWTLPNVVKIDIENDNVDLTLCDVAKSYQPKNNVEPTLECLLGGLLICFLMKKKKILRCSWLMYFKVNSL